MLGSKALQAVRQFSTTAVRRGGHAYEGPGHVSWKKKNVTFLGYTVKCQRLNQITLLQISQLPDLSSTAGNILP